ncbi:MAG: peptide chain release factor N(5)-glutamine methyltransferase [Candidatus Magasanikbacteria bacterium]
MSKLQTLLQQHSKINALDIEIIVAHVLKKPRAFVLAHSDYQLTQAQEKNIRALCKRRQKGEPIAYLTGHKEFFGLDFLVDKRVLVPRPETELLVEEAIDRINNEQLTINKRQMVLIDVGAGSGCVPISIIKTLRDSSAAPLRGFACLPVGMAQNDNVAIVIDISKPALAVAKKNAKKHGVKIKFLHGNLLSPILKNYSLLLTPYSLLVITANLPYGWKEWKNNCSMETRGLQFEPPQALFTGKQGLQLYEDLFKQTQSLLLLNPYSLILLIEYDPRQTTLLKKLIKKYLPEASIEIKKDLAGRDRVATINIKS